MLDDTRVLAFFELLVGAPNMVTTRDYKCREYVNWIILIRGDQNAQCRQGLRAPQTVWNGTAQVVVV